MPDDLVDRLHRDVRSVARIPEVEDDALRNLAYAVMEITGKKIDWGVIDYDETGRIVGRATEGRTPLPEARLGEDDVRVADDVRVGNRPVEDPPPGEGPRLGEGPGVGDSFAGPEETAPEDERSMRG